MVGRSACESGGESSAIISGRKQVFSLRDFMASTRTNDATRGVHSNARLTSEIKQRALELGFNKVGVVRAEALSEERARLEEWLARGLHAGMEWMARGTQRRTDPREILSG